MSGNDLGVIGLGVMGRSLALNAAGRGYAVAVYNRTAERTREFMDRLTGNRIEAAYSLTEFAASLSRPRKVLLMVKAGPATDAALIGLLPELSTGDVLIDGGNAHYTDTERREEFAAAAGVLYLGAGISGGEAGARYGPSIMAGGSEEAYALAGPILEAIAAVGPEGACCAHLGPGSAGHYVKMVHNGIEYAIMQMLAEAYDLMRRGLRMSAAEMADVFDDWNGGEMESFLLETTGGILRVDDSETGDPLVERILDTAAQKGTGKWSSQAALDLGSPASLIAAAVFARALSGLKAERMAAERLLDGPTPSFDVSRDEALRNLRSAVLLATVVAYAQGFRQLRDASEEREYGLSLVDVARVWMAGCIIRSALLVPIGKALREDPRLPCLLTAEPFRSTWREHQAGLRRTVAWACEVGVPVPALGSALAFVDGYRTGRLPANLLQALRDAFGAHTYERIDHEGAFHTDWGE